MATLYSTSGTAPIEFKQDGRPGILQINLDDGSGQVYNVQDLVVVLMNAGALPSRIHEVPC